MNIELEFIPALLVILLAAGVGRLLSRKIRQPAILGELILGMIIGSFIIIAPAAQNPISDVAEIGILLLLFSIGMDLDLEKFKKLAVPASEVAAGGVILPFILGYLIAVFYGFSVEVALFVGAALVATSVGISASILRESGKLRTKVGTLIMGSAVVDDVVGIIMMTVLFGVATTGTLPVLDTLLLILFAILFFVISLTLGPIALGKVSERISVGRENLLLIGLAIVLAFALITEEIGLAAIIGAFVAGLVVGQTHFARSLEGSVSLIGGGFFIPIFFVTMGMGFELDAFTSVGMFAIILIILAVAGKIIGCSLGAKASKFSNRESLAAGVAMVPRAEVALIIASFGFKHGIIEADIVSTILVMVIFTTLVTPTPLWKILKKVK